MSKETKGGKPCDARPKYEPPTVLRMRDARARAGADCGPGTSDAADCVGNGTDAGVGCLGNGAAAVGVCDAVGGAPGFVP